MSDNVAITPGSGATVAADNIGGALYQRVKLALGADGTGVDASAGSGVVGTGVQRVVLATDVALPAGTNAIGKLAANSGVDIGDVDVTSLPASGTATTSTVADSASSATLLSSNAARLGATIVNDSTQAVYVKCGTTASATDFTVKLQPNDYWEVPYRYTGRIDAIWAADASGSARITEFT